MSRNTADDYRPATDDSALPLFASARRSDPATSVAAAESMTAAAVAEHERAILAALERGPAGKTEIARRLAGALTDQQVIRRMAALERRRLVVRTGRLVRSAARRVEAEYRLA